MTEKIVILTKQDKMKRYIKRVIEFLEHDTWVKQNSINHDDKENKKIQALIDDGRDLTE
jgi:hypothetical protein